MKHVIVIGGGAAGCMAAVAAAQKGAAVTLLERNPKLGRKLYITGKGRCNVTNDCAAPEVLQNVPRNSLQRAKELPGVFNNWAVFYRGWLETVNLLDEAGLKRLLSK